GTLDRLREQHPPCPRRAKRGTAAPESAGDAQGWLQTPTDHRALQAPVLQRTPAPWTSKLDGLSTGADRSDRRKQEKETDTHTTHSRPQGTQ
ncbi:hypothetical protein P7K49_005787, partial [Saguinus oedipus]